MKDYHLHSTFSDGKNRKKPGIIESYLMSKSGNNDGGEDRLILGPHFYGVVDGATDKSGNKWRTEEGYKTGGAVLADIVKKVLEDPTNEFIARDTLVEAINDRIHEAAETAGIGLEVVNNRADVGFAAYSVRKNEVYHIHDCAFGFVMGDKSFIRRYHEKPVDRLTSALRATVIKWCEECRIDPFEYPAKYCSQKDLGREFILDLLKRQPEIQNNNFDNHEPWVMAVPYIQDHTRNLTEQYSSNAVSQLNDVLKEAFVGWCKAEDVNVDPYALGEGIGIPYSAVAYKTLNGFPTTIDVTTVPSGTKEIILASDGFRTIKPTLRKTKRVLRRQLKKDPHCIGVLQSTKGLPSTKGLQSEDISYDDRSYLRIENVH